MKVKLLTIVLSVSCLFVTINDCYACPAAHAILHISPVNIFPGHSVTLDGSYSYPDIVEYTWWDGSGWSYTETEGSAPDGAFDGVTTHTYTSIRWHVVWLSVKTQYGKTDTTFGAVRVVKIRNMTSGSGYDTIQDALDYANEGHTIMVLPGAYTENLDFTDKEITLTSTEPDNPDVVAATIIDGGSDGRVVTFGSGDADSTITGFTITNGNLSYGNGGGIYCNGVSPTISNCVISENKADFGSGLYNDSSDPIISNCIFADNKTNSTGWGGGVYNDGSSPEVTNCVFINNYADYYGGGMCNTYSSSPTLTNCTFQANHSTWFCGGMVDMSSSSSTLVNCILWGNTAGSGTIEEEQIYGGSPNVTNSCIQDADPDDTYIPFGGGDPKWNIDDDPYFCSDLKAGLDGLFGTRDDGLFLAIDSPCIDTGSDSAVGGVYYDIIGNARITDGDHDITAPDTDYPTVDMGAYEVPRIWYVDGGATGSNNGKSWTNARTDLQDALISDAAAGDEIWVADGTYEPHDSDPTPDPSVSFEMVEDVGVYGGFGGTEKRSHYDRKWTTYKTILSGDIDGDNSYHVVEAADGAVLDGFIITGGDADGSGDDADGAGIYCDSVSFTFGNCAIVYNTSANFGGGVYCEDSSVTVRNCVFADNTSDAFGGAAFLMNMSGQELTSVFTNCVFSKNEAETAGGGIFFFPSYLGFAEVTNCTFYANKALLINDGIGGGIYNSEWDVTATNCIFWDNEADNNAQIYTYSQGTTTAIRYCDIEDSYVDIENGYVKEDVTNNILGTGGDDNIDADPDFYIDDPGWPVEDGPEGKDGAWATADDGLMLDSGTSPCVDAADGDAAPFTDVTRYARVDIMDVTNEGTGEPDYADIGAYEALREKVHFTGFAMSSKSGIIGGFGYTKAFAEDDYSDFLEVGQYPDTEAELENAVPSTLDGIAIPKGKRLIIYPEKSYGGTPVLNEVGPLIINNRHWDDEPRCISVMTDDWLQPLQTEFPQSVREWSETDMWGDEWRYGSLEIKDEL